MKTEATLEEIWKCEESLTPEQRHEYTQFLTEIARELKPGQSRLAIESDFVVVHATAEQRELALKKTSARKP